MRPGKVISADRTPTRPPAPARAVPLIGCEVRMSVVVDEQEYGGAVTFDTAASARRALADPSRSHELRDLAHAARRRLS